MKLFGLLLGLAALAAAGTNWAEAGKRWWAHVQFLAGDEMLGRETGSSGFDRAADYVAQQFELAGLRAGGTDEFFQPFDLTELKLDEEHSSAELMTAAGGRPVKLGDEAILSVSRESAPAVDAPLVFVGYGLKIPEAGWDDFAAQNLRGAIAVYLRGGPSTIAGNLRAHYSSSEERTKALRAAGAVGVIALLNPKGMEFSWARIKANRLQPKMVLAGADPAGMRFGATWNPDESEALFQGSGHTFQSVLAASDARQPLPHFGLGARLKAATAFTTRAVRSKNVVGIRWGTDPELAHSFVVVSAHLDHLGLGPIGDPDRVFNGAMDDASGVASLIEIARQLRQDKAPTRRSIIFLAVTAEEKGELGSNYYADHPSVEGTYVADINMDMFLPLFPLKYLEVQGLTESTLGDDIRPICGAAGVEVQADKEPDKNRFIRSDQYSFIKHGVPALAFKFGYVPGTPEEKIFQGWYRERYHGVKDDTAQPVDLGAAAQFDDLLRKLLLRVAEAASAPQWKSDSFFRRFVPAGRSS